MPFAGNGQSVTRYTQGVVTQDQSLTIFANQLLTDRNSNGILNAGNVTIPASLIESNNYLIYNAPGATLTIVDTISCQHCQMTFQTQEQKEMHVYRKPKHCRVHGVCFDSWKEHNKKYAHVHCTVEGCSKGVYWQSQTVYRQHFIDMHCF
jgi:hypothetical protein